MKAAGKGRATGCLTCRIRRVKCDEAKPSCRRCTSTGRKCDGYSPIRFSRDELKAASQRSAISPATTGREGVADILPTLICDATFRGAAEKRLFQFFRLCTVQDTNLTTDSRFWDRTVLQASHAEPAIKHAILALGSYHNSTMHVSGHGTANHHRRYADEQYVKALGEARTLIGGDSSPRQLERVLIVCILFIIYEGMVGNYAASQTHMDNARAIVAQNCSSPKSTSSRGNHLAEVCDTLARMDISALTFSESSAPYHYTLGDLLQTVPNLEPTRFSSVRSASASLVDIIRWMLVAGYNPIFGDDLPGSLHSDAARTTHLSGCRERIYRWRRHWNDLLRDNPELDGSLAALNIELWFGMGKIYLDAGLNGPEVRFDGLLDDFKHSVHVGEAVASLISKERDAASFGLDIGFTFPLFSTAIRCRDPDVRRQTIKVLRQHRRREGMWESGAAAAVAEKWMELEEDGLASVKNASDIPEERRISMLDIRIDVSSSTANLHFHSRFRDLLIQDFPLGLNTAGGE